MRTGDVGDRAPIVLLGFTAASVLYSTFSLPFVRKALMKQSLKSFATEREFKRLNTGWRMDIKVH